MPVSSTAMCGPGPAVPCRVTLAGVTCRARSCPAIGGSAAISPRASRSDSDAGNTPPRMAPRSRMCLTSVRVSTPLIPTTPQSRSHRSQPPSAPGASSRSQAARMIAARAHGRSDSIAWALTP